MRISEAMRLGAMLHPQCVGRLVTYGPDWGVAATCAVGAVYEAMGLLAGEFMLSRTERVPGLFTIPATCPVADCHILIRGITGIPCDLFNAITHLNDEHGWSRERIADWVETIEPAEAVTAEEKEKEVAGASF